MTAEPQAAAEAPRKLRLFPVLPDQFVDSARRLWVLDVQPQPGSRRDRSDTPSRCEGCGHWLGAVAYLRQATGAEARCAECVEVVTYREEAGNG